MTERTETELMEGLKQSKRLEQAAGKQEGMAGQQQPSLLLLLLLLLALIAPLSLPFLPKFLWQTNQTNQRHRTTTNRC